MSVRANQIKNFRGQSYATQAFVQQGFVAILETAPSSIDVKSLKAFYYAGADTDTYKNGHTYQLQLKDNVYSYKDLGSGGTQLFNNALAVKPFEWSANGSSCDMTIITDDNGATVEGIKLQKGARYIILDAIIFNVLSRSNGLAYGDLYYLSGDNKGKTLVVFDEWDDNYFKYSDDGNGNITYSSDGLTAARFIGYGFVKNSGGLISVLDISKISNDPK